MKHLVKVLVVSVMIVGNLVASDYLFENIADPLAVTIEKCSSLQKSSDVSDSTKRNCQKFTKKVQPILDKDAQVRNESRKKKVAYMKELRGLIKTQGRLGYALQIEGKAARKKGLSELFLTIASMPGVILDKNDAAYVKKNKKTLKGFPEYALVQSKLSSKAEYEAMMKEFRNAAPVHHRPSGDKVAHANNPKQKTRSSSTPTKKGGAEVCTYLVVSEDGKILETLTSSRQDRMKLFKRAVQSALGYTGKASANGMGCQ